MFEVGDKFIIELGKECDVGLGLYEIKGTRHCIDKKDLMNLRMFRQDIADAYYEQGYVKAMEEIQKAVRTFRVMNNEDRKRYFDGKYTTAAILDTFDPREIVEKLQLYEEEKSKIKVGDEVEIVGLGSKAVVTSVYEYERCVFVLYYDGSTDEFTDRTKLKKTGRHFDEVEKLIEILKGGDSDEIPF